MNRTFVLISFALILFCTRVYCTSETRAPYFQSISFVSSGEEKSYVIKGKVIDIVSHFEDNNTIIDSVKITIENSLSSQIENEINTNSKEFIWIYPTKNYQNQLTTYPLVEKNKTYIASLHLHGVFGEKLSFYPYADYYSLIPIEDKKVEIYCYKIFDIEAIFTCKFRNIVIREMNTGKFQRKTIKINKQVNRKKANR